MGKKDIKDHKQIANLDNSHWQGQKIDKHKESNKRNSKMKW